MSLVSMPSSTKKHKHLTITSSTLTLLLKNNYFPKVTSKPSAMSSADEDEWKIFNPQSSISRPPYHLSQKAKLVTAAKTLSKS